MLWIWTLQDKDLFLFVLGEGYYAPSLLQRREVESREWLWSAADEGVGSQMEKVDRESEAREAGLILHSGLQINVECVEMSGDCTLLPCLAMMARRTSRSCRSP